MWVKKKSTQLSMKLLDMSTRRRCHSGDKGEVLKSKPCSSARWVGEGSLEFCVSLNSEMTLAREPLGPFF